MNDRTIMIMISVVKAINNSKASNCHATRLSLLLIVSVSQNDNKINFIENLPIIIVDLLISIIYISETDNQWQLGYAFPETSFNQIPFKSKTGSMFFFVVEMARSDKCIYPMVHSTLSIRELDGLELVQTESNIKINFTSHWHLPNSILNIGRTQGHLLKLQDVCDGA